ncbi:unnamed protein product [Ectocarpus sp. 12 AP-2014]
MVVMITTRRPLQPLRHLMAIRSTSIPNRNEFRSGFSTGLHQKMYFHLAWQAADSRGRRGLTTGRDACGRALVGQQRYSILSGVYVCLKRAVYDGCGDSNTVFGSWSDA